MATREVKIKHITKLVDEGDKSITLTDAKGRTLEHEKSPVVETVEEEYNPATTVQPVQAFMSTNLNNKIATYQDLMERILMFFGWPSVSVPDLHRD